MEKKKQGFALLTKERLQEIARAGGKQSHASGKAHKFTPEEARAAAAKAGRIAADKPGNMAKLGKLGGSAMKKKFGKGD